MVETEIGCIKDPVGRFFAYARERHGVYLRRLAGLPKQEWTKDGILAECRFTNVFRELDRTTVWFNRHVRGPLRDKPEVLPATVVFRWFNRTSTGEALFCQPCLPNLNPGATAFDEFLFSIEGRTPGGAVDPLRHAILRYCGAGPYVTGAYTINTISAGLGKTKLEGVLDLIRQWFELHPDWRAWAEMCMGSSMTLEYACDWLRSPCLGEFMTYEVACDLRHTALLARAPDVDTWANLGPGANRGLNRIYFPGDRKVGAQLKTDYALGRMRELLALSREPGYWPRRGHKGPQVASGPEDWPAWELREVEHTLCEFDKYERVRLGEGRPRGSAPRC